MHQSDRSSTLDPARRATAESLIYSRLRGGAVRYYADFRRYQDVGGSQEALVPEGATRATSDRAMAIDLALDRLIQLEHHRGSSSRVTRSRFVSKPRADHA